MQQNTIAIQVIHFGGVPCNMDEIIEYSRKNNLVLIEDCAQSFGSKWNNRNVGSYGDISCFSLTKNLYGIGGGILATDNEFVFRNSLELQKKFPKTGMKPILFRIIKNIIETKRSNKKWNYIYTQLMNYKKRKELSVKSFKKALSYPSSFYFKISTQQFIKMLELHKKRILNAKEIIMATKNIDIYFISDFANSTPSFVKLNGILKKGDAQQIIYNLNKIGVECKHLEHKYLTYYQKRFDFDARFIESIGLLKCKNYLSIHDRLISFPLFEDMGKDCINLMTYKIKKVMN
jgi:dTDP-4-amino-4,6-dideoxygalactose transaminase